MAGGVVCQSIASAPSNKALQQAALARRC